MTSSPDLSVIKNSALTHVPVIWPGFVLLIFFQIKRNCMDLRRWICDEEYRSRIFFSFLFLFFDWVAGFLLIVYYIRFMDV